MESGELLLLGAFFFLFFPSPFLLLDPQLTCVCALQIPMVAPFLGTTFGGFMYDLLLNDGDSPVNTPWLGLKRLVPGAIAHKRRRPSHDINGSPV